jgi:hypothetical protein
LKPGPHPKGGESEGPILKSETNSKFECLNVQNKNQGPDIQISWFWSFRFW